MTSTTFAFSPSKGKYIYIFAFGLFVVFLSFSHRQLAEVINQFQWTCSKFRHDQNLDLNYAWVEFCVVSLPPLKVLRFLCNKTNLSSNGTITQWKTNVCNNIFKRTSAPHRLRMKKINFQKFDTVYIENRTHSWKWKKQ